MPKSRGLADALIAFVCAVSVAVVMLGACGVALSWCWHRSAVAAFGAPSLDWRESTYLLLSVWLMGMPVYPALRK
jgi:hypothetical protein